MSFLSNKNIPFLAFEYLFSFFYNRFLYWRDMAFIYVWRVQTVATNMTGETSESGEIENHLDTMEK